MRHNQTKNVNIGRSINPLKTSSLLLLFSKENPSNTPCDIDLDKAFNIMRIFRENNVIGIPLNFSVNQILFINKISLLFLLSIV